MRIQRLFVFLLLISFTSSGFGLTLIKKFASIDGKFILLGEEQEKEDKQEKEENVWGDEKDKTCPEIVQLTALEITGYSAFRKTCIDYKLRVYAELLVPPPKF